MRAFQSRVPVRQLRWAGICALLLLTALVLAACPAAATPAPAQPQAEAPAPTEAPAAEPTAEPEPEATAAAEAMMTFSGNPDAGQYIFTLIGGCSGCHFNREVGGLAGGNRFEGPFGVVYAANITPDIETGIGSYSEEDIVSLLRTGARSDGYQLSPAMPYRVFSALSDQEALDIAAYLYSLDPIANPIPARELVSEPAAFTPAVAPPAEPPADAVARGEQLVILARCSNCHTPANEDGSPNMDLLLAGAVVRDAVASNITPDEETGIGSWTEEEIATLMRTGARPDGSAVEGAMAQQIERRFNVLTEADALAIAAYLKSIPAVSNNPGQ